MKKNNESKAWKKLGEICKNTDDPNFAFNYQLGVVNLLTESLGGLGEITKEDKDKSFDEGLKDIMGEEDFEKATSKEIDWKSKLIDLINKEKEHSQMMFECAKVNEADWEGVDAVKKMRERTRKLTYHNMEKRLIQLEKHIKNLIDRI
ncbi:MAG: hypothetical protein Unbinned5930contig1000_9 [Prokaryotic dsDNA virus sp.]|nr:MAG: hypothetical protein Unbinned5930contig1000_9 [Prokaryotic dsDNA virus sp.]|tara:strand:+ start:2573 stop:3016 length:444 start_codon:yes stop_codon:yes gene_type:complete